MHTYRYSVKDGRYEVIFDPGADEYVPLVLKTFPDERSAIMFVHYLNGGEVSEIFLRLATVEKGAAA